MSSTLRRWLVLSALGAAAAAAVGVLGALVLAGDRRAAFLAGAGASVAAALAGAVPLARAGGGREGIAAIGKATALRFLVAVGAAVVGAVVWRLEKGPLFTGLAASYVAVLAAETSWLVRGGGGRD